MCVCVHLIHITIDAVHHVPFPCALLLVLPSHLCHTRGLTHNHLSLSVSFKGTHTHTLSIAALNFTDCDVFPLLDEMTCLIMHLYLCEVCSSRNLCNTTYVIYARVLYIFFAWSPIIIIIGEEECVLDGPYVPITFVCAWVHKLRHGGNK